MNIRKIDSLELKKNSYFKNKALKKSRRINEIKFKDKVEISSVGKQLSFCMLNEDTNINDEKIFSIQKQIKNGNYKIDSKLIAKKILKSIKEKY